ncbi:hypothetical protein, partial [Pseudomonas aeruginosa]|uniref:hypothetical protein n=1 Tax=Pseudomonas aeruginosa TaxID=287 RepID=UPI0032E4FC0C
MRRGQESRRRVDAAFVVGSFRSSLGALVSPAPGRTIESVACASEGQRMFAAANQTHFSLALDGLALDLQVLSFSG